MRNKRMKQDEAMHVTDGSCDRCGGLMYGVSLLDMKSSQERRIEARECILCGDIVDPTILRNRRRSLVVDRLMSSNDSGGSHGQNFD